MKKLILNTTLLLTTMLSTCALAADPVCNSTERPWATDSRFFDTGISSSDGNTVANFFDLKTIKIDKEKKIIKAWVIREASKKGRSNYTQKSYSFSNYGYDKMLWTIDYGNMRLRDEPASAMNCDGSVILTIPDSGEWEDFIPLSINEMVAKKIMQKYNLK